MKSISLIEYFATKRLITYRPNLQTVLHFQNVVKRNIGPAACYYS